MIDLLLLTSALLTPPPIAQQNTPFNSMSAYHSQHNNALVEHNIVDGGQHDNFRLLTKEIGAELQHQMVQLLDNETIIEVNKSPLDTVAISNNY